MKEYIFTFGWGQRNEGYAQPIFAKDKKTAVEKMVELHGYSWAFVYTREQWEENYDILGHLMESELEAIYVREDDE